MRSLKQRWSARHGLLSASLAWPLLSGCGGGLHLHEPADAKLAQEAEAAFKDAGLSKALQDERTLVTEQNARHRAAVRAHVEARRDAKLAMLLGQEYEQNGKFPAGIPALEQTIDQRLLQLAGSPTKAGGQQVQIQPADQALSYKQLRPGWLRSTIDRETRELSRLKEDLSMASVDPALLAQLSCPLPQGFACPPAPGCDQPAVQRHVKLYQDTCDALQDHHNALKEALSADPSKGELQRAMAEVERLHTDKAAVEKALDLAQGSYTKAWDDYQSKATSECPSGTADCLQKAASDLQARLGNIENEFKRDLGTVDALLPRAQIGLKLADTSQKLQVLRCSLGLIAHDPKPAPGGTGTAAGEACPDPVNAESDNELKVAATVAALNDLAKISLRPPMAALLIEAEQLRLQRDHLKRQLEMLDRQIALAEIRSAQLQTEVEYLVAARSSLKEYGRTQGCSSRIGLMAAVRGGKHSATCAEMAAQAITAYLASWHAGQLPARETESAQIGLRHEEVLDTSEDALAQWDQLLGVPIAVLRTYHQSGIKPEDLANLIHALGLGAIAIRVK